MARLKSNEKPCICEHELWSSCSQFTTNGVSFSFDS